MKKRQVLLKRVQPYSDESLAGYMIRLTEVNYYDSVKWVLQLANIEYGLSICPTFYTRDVCDLKELGFIAKIPEESLWKLTIQPEYTGGYYGNLFGHKISLHSLHSHNTKVCPECLKEQSYIRKIWDLSIVTVCPIHGCLLIDACPNCKQKINWQRSSVSKCKCGYNYQDTPLLKVSEVEMLVSNQVYNICGILTPMNGHKIPSLAELSLAQLTSIAIFMSMQFCDKVDTTGKKFAVSYDNSFRHQLLSKFIETFSNWPNNFYSFLHWRRNRKKDRNRDTGIKAEFGGFYDALYDCYSDDEFELVRSAFEIYVTEQWDGGYVNSKLRLKNGEQNKNLYSQVKTASILGIKFEWVSRMVEQGVLEAISRPMGTRTMMLVTADSVEKYKKSLERAITLQQVASVLKIGHESVVQLIEAGCLKALRGPKVDGYLSWMVLPEDIFAFLTEITKQKDNLITNGKTMVYTDVLRKLTFVGINTVGLIQMVTDGQLKVYNRTPALSLAELEFSTDQVEARFNQLVIKNKEGYLTVQDVSLTLGVKQEVVLFWIKRGFIYTEGVISQDAMGRERRKISKESIAAFTANYMVSSQIPNPDKVHPKYLIERIMQQGIKPVSGPRIDGGRQYLFLRQDFDKAG